MSKGKIRHMFLGGNTSQGFFSYYDYILSQEEATRIICIKGGPGVGKSTFMKKIGKEMEDRGYDVEYMHCSSDNNSIDGVVIPAIKVALLDGTAPHEEVSYAQYLFDLQEVW
ncbi:MAG: ATPase [Clostridiaceae bacterium]|jgi:MoxR-like ATPase|nr:ATPase [Clostridiaceae bacterium]